MKNKALNTLSYTGIVTLSKYVGTKKVKLAQAYNTGGTSLFSFLADCLIGEFATAQKHKPARIMLLSYNEDTMEYDSISGFVSIRTKPTKVESETQCKVRYSFILPRDLIEKSSNTTEISVGLYSNDADYNKPENYIARCDLGIQSGQLTTTSLVVDWELIIANNTSKPLKS